MENQEIEELKKELKELKNQVDKLKAVVSNKTDPCAWHRCFCNVDFSNMSNPEECTQVKGRF